MRHWTFSDIFEEQGVVETPFIRRFRVVGENVIPKPALTPSKAAHAGIQACCLGR